MSKPVRNLKRDKWEERIAQWRKTNMSAREWCRLNQVSRSSFYYWLRKLCEPAMKKQTKPQVTREAFIEIPPDNSPEQTGIEIQCRGVIVRVEKAFDEEAFSRVVGVLRRLSC